MRIVSKKIEDPTTITISRETVKKLRLLFEKGDTYESVILRLLEGGKEGGMCVGGESSKQGS
jgi:predicted CopG family antitoxin